MKRFINGTPVTEFEMTAVGDHHLIINETGTSEYRVSHVEYTGHGHMDLSVMENGNFQSLHDAVQAVHHDRQKAGLPSLHDDDWTDPNSTI
jgi:hypothetical protein